MNMTPLLLTLALPLAASANQLSAPSTLLVPNAFTTDAALAHSWEGTWLGVFLGADEEAFVRPLEVDLYSPEAEPGVGEPTRFFPSLSLSNDDGAVLLFLVRDLPGIESGSLRLPDAAWRDAQLLPGTLIDFFFQRSALVLQAHGSASFEEIYELRLRDYSIVLTSPDRDTRQVLWSRSKGLSATPILRWAGDLDRDGHIDLLLEEPALESGDLHYELYLSSQARTGEYMRRAGDVEGIRDGC